MEPIYVVTDIEADGPTPGRNSMLSFASVAVNAGLEVTETFEAVLAPLEDAEADPVTLAWFKAQPEAWAAATQNPEPPARIMSRYADWIGALPGAPIFTAHPLAFDGAWLDHYLRRFLEIRLLKGPWPGPRLFYTAGLCLQSFAAGRLGWTLWDCATERYPPDWLGNHPHSHKAIDDARGYAHLLITLMRHEGAPGMTSDAV